MRPPKFPKIKVRRRKDRPEDPTLWFFYSIRGEGQFKKPTGVKSKDDALKIAYKAVTEHWKATLVKVEEAAKIVPEPIQKGRTISAQILTFIGREMRFMSVSYKRSTTRQLGYLTSIRSDKGKGEARNLVEDITPESLDALIADLDGIKLKKDGEPYAPKTWSETLTDWDRFLEWEAKQDGTPLRRNYAADLPRPDKKKFGKRKEMWALDEWELFMADAKKGDPELYELSLVVRWSSMDPADYFDFAPSHMVLKDDERWYVNKERAKEPGQFYQVPIDKTHLLDLFLQKKAEAPSPDSRMFTGHKYKDHQRESWGSAISNRRKRLFEKLLPGKKTKTFKDMRRTFFDYWIRKGIPTPVVQLWGGHSEGSAVTTTNYSDWRLTAEMMEGKKGG